MKTRNITGYLRNGGTQPIQLQVGNQGIALRKVINPHNNNNEYFQTITPMMHMRPRGPLRYLTVHMSLRSVCFQCGIS